jgi:uncharacterized protein (DUF433 family)
MGTASSKYYDKNSRLVTSALIPGYSWICQAPGYMGGQPAIFGKRISVSFILECLEQGLTSEEIAQDYDIPIEAVQEAIHFASDIVWERAIV